VGLTVSAAPVAPPTVTVHYAQTLDGRIATRSGHSQWVSGQASLCLAHELRAAHDAVAVGLGTVLADDPRLTVRLAPGTSPTRVVLDSRLRLPLDCNVLRDGAAPTIVATTPHADRARIDAVRACGAEVVVLPVGGGGVDLTTLLGCLGARGMRSVLVEGGSKVITSLLRERLVRRLVVCIAPKVLGGGVEAVGDLSIDSLHDALTFEESTFRVLGGDIIFEGSLPARTVVAV
jgi:riboflavin-specific deaminase-like protein